MFRVKKTVCGIKEIIPSKKSVPRWQTIEGRRRFTIFENRCLRGQRSLFGELRRGSGFTVAVGVEAATGASAHGFARTAVSTRIAGSTRVTGSTRIARTTSVLRKAEAVEELFEVLARMVEETSELFPASTGIARTTGIVTCTTGIACTTGIVACSTGIARTTGTVTRTTTVTAGATQFAETFEKLLERKTRTAIGIARTAHIVTRTTGIVARIATIVTTGSTRITRIASFRRKQSLQAASEYKFSSTTIIASEIATGATRIAIGLTTGCAGNNRIARVALARCTRTARNKLLETRKQVAGLGATVTRPTRIHFGARTTIMCISPHAHQHDHHKGDHQQSGLHWVDSPFPGWPSEEKIPER